MCGIMGYTGVLPATPIIIKGLEKLQYRGYDSAGIGLLNKKPRLSISDFKSE